MELVIFIRFIKVLVAQFFPSNKIINHQKAENSVRKSPRHCASSGFWQRIQLPDVEGRC
jgi:hypothetical protein